MDVMDRFVMGEASLEEALLSRESEEAITICLALGRSEVLLGVRERGAAPVFTRVPAGLGAGFGVAAGHVFQALDRTPPREARSAPRQVFPTFPETPRGPEGSPAPSAPLRAGLVGALADLAKEVMTNADR